MNFADRLFRRPAVADVGPDRRASGASGGRAVVFVHGSLASGGMWKSYAGAVEPQFSTRAPDLVGHGRNPAWPPDRRFRLADEVAGLAGRVEGLCEPIDIVAHSYGGLVALRFAWENFDRVRSLMLIEPTCFRVLSDPVLGEGAGAERAEIAAVADAVRQGVRLGEPAAAMCRFVEYWNGPGAWRALADDLKDRFAGQAVSVMGNFDAADTDEMPLAELRDLAIPTLLVSGGRSTAAARRTTAIVAGLLPRAEAVEIADAGHMSPVTHAGVVRPLVEGWLKEGRVVPQMAA
ncbi:alpha/beta hydrolase [Microbaculum marinum]|uniref:Alpha/beta hydrolase n=1 Tax=Microbaculum marinum TaxID=1764581 RepID=A0AAW9RNQ8_9HYPH